MRRLVNAMIAALLVWVPSAWAFPLTFSTDPSGNLVVTSSSSGTFPMAGYRRSFSTTQELAQFCADNLGATPVYDGAGQLVGVKGTLITIGSPSYYNRAGQLVTVDNPVVRFLGGTTGSFVVGNQLWYLQATDAASAVTPITPAPTEDVWAGSSPPSSAASAAHLAELTATLSSGDRCTGSPPVCYVNGQRGHKQCDFDTLQWTGCVVDGPPPSASVSVAAPTSLNIPLGVYGVFQGSVYNPVAPYDNHGTWSAPAGSGSITQGPLTNTFTTSGTFSPYNYGTTTITFASNAFPSVTATATVTIPTTSALQANDPYPSQIQQCVSGDQGTRGCLIGATYHNNWWLMNERGIGTTYGVGAQGSNLYDNPYPGPRVALSANGYFYYNVPSGSTLLYSEPIGTGTFFNVSTVGVRRYRVFFVGGGPGFKGVDDIVGACASHSGPSGLGGRTSQDAYINGCRTQ